MYVLTRQRTIQFYIHKVNVVTFLVFSIALFLAHSNIFFNYSSAITSKKNIVSRQCSKGYQSVTVYVYILYANANYLSLSRDSVESTGVVGEPPRASEVTGAWY